MFLLNNQTIKYIISIFFLLSYIILNKLISQMGIAGISVNLIGIFILFLLIYLQKIEYLLLFFIFNILVGPFLIVNFSELNLDSLGRLDYFIGNSLMIYFILHKYKQTKLVLIFLLILFLSLLVNYSNSIGNISMVYAYVSKISIGYLFYYFWINKHLFIKKTIVQIFLYLLVIHFILSLIQFIFPLYIRRSSIEAGLIILGHYINRPLGFFGSSYVYGVTTIFLLMLYYHYKGYVNKIDKIFIFLFFILAIISTRSIGLGILLYAIYLVYISTPKIKRNILFFIFSLIAVYIIYSNYQLIFLNQSNSTKFLLWYLALKEIMINSSIIQILFGHGIDTSSLLANNLPDFVSNLLFEAKYDNRIDNFNTNGFPIHNIYIQILYENGSIIFLFIAYFIFKIFNNMIKYKINTIESFLFVLIISNYLLHNGIYSSYLFFIIFVMLDKIKKVKYGINNRINI